MTPEDEQMTIEDAFQRITEALGSDRSINVSRMRGYHRWTCYCVAHCGDVHQGKRTGGHVITVHHDRLGAALAQLVRDCEAHAERLRGMRQGKPPYTANGHDHAQAATGGGTHE